MSGDLPAPRGDGAGVPTAVGLLAARLLLITVAGVLGGFVVAAANGRFVLPPGSMVATWTILPVNLVSLLLVFRAARASGLDLRQLVTGGRATPMADLGWALLWSAVLGLPFTGTLFAVLWLWGVDPLAAMEHGFVNQHTGINLPGDVALLVGIATMAGFVLLNGPTEELLFRGVAQSGLSRRSATLGVAVPALAFGVQHAWFAATIPMAVAMAVAFTVWGLGAGLVVRWQGRLLPMIICHALVNAMTSAPAVILPAVTG